MRPGSHSAWFMSEESLKANTHGAFLCGAPDERQDDEALVPSLVFVHRVHLHAGEDGRLQQGRDALQLQPVGGDDSDIAGLTPRLKKQTKGGLAL